MTDGRPHVLLKLAISAEVRYRDIRPGSRCIYPERIVLTVSSEQRVFVERIPFDETRAYIKRVLASQAAYAYLYEPKALDELLALGMNL